MLTNQEVFDIEGGPVTGQFSHELPPLDPALLLESKNELERVLNHASINRSTNLVRFLSFVCNKYFEGEAEEIRERTVAVEALGRKESSFDSHADPIVRVTARELRKKLGEFYENEGRNHRIQIVLPRGRYIPQFVQRQMLPPDVSPVLAAAEGASSLPSESSAAHAVDLPQTLVSPAENTGWKKLPQYFLATGVLIAVFFAGYFAGHRRSSSAMLVTMPITWGAPAWSDEFDGASGQPPDPSRWLVESNSQTPPCPANSTCSQAKPTVFLNGAGQLILRASKNHDDSWTTPKVSTRGLKDFQYGRIEARMKLPVGAGLWPAFWLMGSNFSKVSWPASGSVDIMENVGAQNSSQGLGPNVIRSTMHGPGSFGQTGMWHNYKLPNNGRVDDSGFHTYGIIWSPQMMQFYVDDPSNVYFTKQASELPKGTEWVFDKPFYMIISLSVGGDWPGSADNLTPNPADMVVDYVRVYNLPSTLQK